MVGLGEGGGGADANTQNTYMKINKIRRLCFETWVFLLTQPTSGLGADMHISPTVCPGLWLITNGLEQTTEPMQSELFEVVCISFISSGSILVLNCKALSKFKGIKS